MSAEHIIAEDRSTTQDVVGDTPQMDIRRPWWQETAVVLAARYAVPVRDMLGDSMERRLSEPRQHLMYEMRERGLSYPVIARLLKRDHTTVLFGVRAHKRRAGL